MKIFDQHDIDDLILSGFQKLSPWQKNALKERIKELSIKRGLTYQKKAGVTEPMNLIPVPAVIQTRHIGYLARLCWEIIAIVKKIIPLYLENQSIRETLPLHPWEERWLKECWHPDHHIRQPLIYRLDADMKLSSENGAHDAIFFESNSVAVGGMFYAPVAESIIIDSTLKELNRIYGLPGFGRNQDTRMIVLKKIKAHAASLGRRSLNIAMLEDKRWDVGITEFPSFVDFCRKQGVSAYLADPRELSLAGGEIRYRGKVIDIIYRNMELRDLQELEDEGVDMTPLKVAFKRNQVISSLSGEFDHKSLWEALSSRAFDRLFTGSQKKLLSRHIPWTRLVYERRTTGPDGKNADLADYIAANRESLVIKPNRHYGGIGISIGMGKTQAEWEGLLDRCLRQPREWVVQRFINNSMKRLPWFWGRGGARVLPMYTTYGFISTPQGFGMVGRACTRRIVNVGRGGALLSVLRLP